jgi:hypothetical protein
MIEQNKKISKMEEKNAKLELSDAEIRKENKQLQIRLSKIENKE